MALYGSPFALVIAAGTLIRPTSDGVQMLQIARRIVLMLIILGTLLCVPASAMAMPTAAIVGGVAEGGATNEQYPRFYLSVTTGSEKTVNFYCSLDNPVFFDYCGGADFQCIVNGASQTCTGWEGLNNPTSGPHVFRVFASECDTPCSTFDEGDDGPIVSRAFTVDRTAPVLTLTSGPTVERPVLKGTPRFTVTTSEPASLICRRDTGREFPCASPINLGKTSNGNHSLFVYALDAAGNRSNIVRQRYRVDVLSLKKCRRGKTAIGKAKFKKCRKSNLIARRKWEKRNGK